MQLMRLQEQFNIALTQAETASDDESRAIWQAIAAQYSNLIAIRLEAADPGEFNNGDWYLSHNDKRAIVGDASFQLGQQLIHMGHGHFGTGRYTLKLGDGTVLTSSDLGRLKAVLVAYLNKQPFSPEIKADLVAKFF